MGRKSMEEEIYVHMWLIHIAVQQNRTQHCKASISSVQFSSVTQSCPTYCDPMNHGTPGLPVHHQLPEFTQLMSIELVIPSSHLILCRPLLPLPPIPPSIRVFSNESTLRIRWPKYRSLWVAFQTHPGRQAFFSSGSKEARSALESRRVSLGAHWVDSRESSLLRRLERGREIGR